MNIYIVTEKQDASSTNNMTSSEFSESQRKLGMTNAEFAEALGVTPDTIVKRKAGRVKITKQASIAVKNLLESNI